MVLMINTLAVIAGLAASVISSAQPTAPATSAEVVCFRHTLRWVGESSFPNYFQLPEVREAVFRDIEHDLKLRFGVADVLCPSEVEYGIILSVGPPDETFPDTASTCDYRVAIFSFITRQMASSAVSWSVKVVVKDHDKTVLAQESEHELEYFGPAGPPPDQAWMSPGEFARICSGLIMEAMGVTASSPGKVVVGSPQAEGEEASAQAPRSTGLAAGEPAPGASGYGLGLGVLVATGLGPMFTDLNGHPGFGFQVQGYVPLAARIQLRPAFEWTGYRVSDYNLLARVFYNLLGVSYEETRVVFRTYRLGLDGLFYFRNRYVGPFLSGGVGVQISRAYVEDRVVYEGEEEIIPLAEGASTTGLWLGGGVGYQWPVGNVELRLSRAPYGFTGQRDFENQPDTLAVEEQPGWTLHLLLGLRF
jgi:hypothetical protein